MILIDPVGKLWLVMITSAGQIVTHEITPQPTVLISDPTGGRWQLGITSDGTFTTTKIA